jgi:hypothetical protein
MSESESKLNAQAVVYFVISPLEGPAYRICGDDDLQAVGGVHALERRLENESYWFAPMGQISLQLNSDGVTFQDSETRKTSRATRGRMANRATKPGLPMGQISLQLNSDGVTFQDSELAKLREPLEGAWQTGRLNPATDSPKLRNGHSKKYSRRFSECWIRVEQLTAPQWKASH